MRTVRFDPAALAGAQKAWWDTWSADADGARIAVLDAWSRWVGTPPPLPPALRPPFKPALKQEVWSELKRWLNEHVFGERCAYCEAPLDGDRYAGDAEHFRPKGRVTWRVAGRQQIARCRLADGSEIEHPGYFWLAYDWRNLIPACAFCNSGRGKVDQFPVGAAHAFDLDAAGARYAPGAVPAPPDAFETPAQSRRYFLAPGKLDAIEAPLLLNPLNAQAADEPIHHLRYGLGGTVVAIDGSARGQASIDVFDLQRDRLRRRRQEAQETAHRAYYGALFEPGGDPQARADGVMKSYADGKDYSSAVLDYLRERIRLQGQGVAG